MGCDGYPRIPMPLMCTAFVPGQIDAAVAGISDPDSRTVATAEALYFRGQATLAAETARPHLDATDLALRYSACFICGYASLSLNRIADARRCLAGSLGRERPAALAFPVFRRRVLSACGASARRPAPVRRLRDGARLVSARRIRPQSGHGGKRPDHETGKLSDLGTVPAPGSFHGMHEPQGHRRR